MLHGIFSQANLKVLLPPPPPPPHRFPSKAAKSAGPFCPYIIYPSQTGYPCIPDISVFILDTPVFRMPLYSGYRATLLRVLLYLKRVISIKKTNAPFNWHKCSGFTSRNSINTLNVFLHYKQPSLSLNDQQSYTSYMKLLSTLT